MGLQQSKLAFSVLLQTVHLEISRLAVIFETITKITVFEKDSRWLYKIIFQSFKPIACGAHQYVPSHLCTKNENTSKDRLHNNYNFIAKDL